MTNIKVTYILPDGSEFIDESAPFILKPGDKLTIGKSTYFVTQNRQMAWYEGFKINGYSIITYLAEWN